MSTVASHVRVASVSVSVETRRSDDLYAGASPDGDGVEAERWPLLDGDGGRREMVRGRFGSTRGQRVENPRWTARWRGVLRRAPRRATPGPPCVPLALSGYGYELCSCTSTAQRPYGILVRTVWRRVGRRLRTGGVLITVMSGSALQRVLTTEYHCTSVPYM